MGFCWKKKTTRVGLAVASLVFSLSIATVVRAADSTSAGSGAYGGTSDTSVTVGDAIDPANLPPDEFNRAKILEVTDERSNDAPGGLKEETQDVRALILGGKEAGREITLTNGGVISVGQFQKVKAGDIVVLYKSYKVDGGAQYYITDYYRLYPLLFVFLAFAGLVVLFSRWKGLGSLLGLAFSMLVLVKFIVPRVIAGGSPLAVTLVGTLAIAGVSLYLAHGFNRRTSVALIGTVITLALTLGFSEIFVRLASLSGRGSEEALYLQMGDQGMINLRGLLLAGIIIGTLGVLDDITTAQTAVVGELRRADPRLRPSELYRRGLVVGKEHISSLVNTLVLAYAGASLPLFILFTANRQAPLWTIVNSELVAEEFVRTIIGSIALVLAVPISTVLAAYLLRNEKNADGETAHLHVR